MTANSSPRFGSAPLDIYNNFTDSTPAATHQGNSNSPSSTPEASSTHTNNVNTDATININNPNMSVNLPVRAINNLAGSTSAAMGMGAAIKAMQHKQGALE